MTRRFVCFALATLLCFVAAVSVARAATESVSLDGTWRIVADPENVGVGESWFGAPLAEPQTIPVPGTLQEVFRGYHGVVWYEREFATPANPNGDRGRAILRFEQVEYRADVWLNGVALGAHEGGEEAFELDATDALKPEGETNRLTVRALNAADEPIDGISMANIPSRNNTNVATPGCGYASGGIVDSVSLELTPVVRIADLQLIPNWRTGEIETRVTFVNYGTEEIDGALVLSAAPVDGGDFTRPAAFKATVKPGAFRAVGKFVVSDFKLWNLNDPNLYSVLAEFSASDAGVSDRRVATCGFRDFRFENGYFRLNGKRIYVKCSHSGSDSPISHRVPFDPDLYRKDILTCKTMGFNMIRYIAGMPRRFQLDLCDRVGFLVYDECLAGWMFGACPEREERWVAQTSAMIRRDRNHPSVVIWGLLNETTDTNLVLQAAAFLEKARELDPDRMIFLNSGGFDVFANEAPKTADYAIWRGQTGAIMPGAIKNETNKTFFFDGSEWPAGCFFLHPGDVGNEYAVATWTAPKTGAYRLDASFRDVVVHGAATVDIRLVKSTLDGGRALLWRGGLNIDGAGKFARLTSSAKEEAKTYRVIADVALMKKFNVSTISFFEALKSARASYELEKVEPGQPILVKTTPNPGATIDEIAKMTVVDLSGEPVPFSEIGRIETIEQKDDSLRIPQSALVFNEGESLSIIVGVGDDKGTGDTTAVEFRMTDEEGAVYDVVDDFSWERNPNGVWKFGRLPAGPEPNLDAFELFEVGQKTLDFEPIGRFANPGGTEWLNELADTHPYKTVPHTAAIIDELRTHNKNGLPVFLSEYGIGSAVDLWRLTRLFEQYGAEEAADAKDYRARYDGFMKDWTRWKLDDVFATPTQFFQDAIAQMAEQRRYGINAIRANADVVAHSVTGTHDQGFSGEGLTTIFRELKPGTVDAMAEVFAPLRFCNFVEPNQAYIGQKVKIESVLVNEDVLSPGDYPVRFVAVGPNNERFFDETRVITIPEATSETESPFSIPVLSAEFVVPVGSTEGECKFFAEIQRGGAARGEERFFTFDRRRFPLIGEGRIFVWGEDVDLQGKLRVVNIETVALTSANEETAAPRLGDRVVVGKTSPRLSREDFAKLYSYAQNGVGVLFLSADVFADGNETAAKMPFDVKGQVDRLPNWLYHKDDWGRRDAAFAGLRSGGVLDYAYYRDVIPVATFKGQSPEPTVAIAGAFNTQMGYDAGLSLAEWKFGRGKIIVSTWLLQENLPSPIAERMLRNLLIKASPTNK